MLKAREFASLHSDERWQPLVLLMQEAQAARREAQRKEGGEKEEEVRDVIYVSSVAVDSALYAEGMRDNDMITHINDLRVNNIRELQTAWNKLVLGEQVKITARRYTIVNDSLVAETNEDGNYVLNEKGEPQWEYELVTFNIKASNDIGLAAQDFTIPIPRLVAKTED